MLFGLASSAPQKTLEETKAEFDALSPEEKEIVHRDLYGIGNYGIVEQDDFIKNSLNSFEKFILDIPDDDKKEYLLALEASQDYVKDRDLRLQFLRCELFDCKVCIFF
jgi:Ribonuclease G/E